MSAPYPRATAEEAVESLRETGRLVRTVQNRMRADGLREAVEYRDPDLRVATALAAVEAPYHEAKRHHDRLTGGGRR